MLKFDRFRIFGRIRFLLAVALIVSGCSNLSVFVPPPKASSLEGEPNLAVNGEGQLVLDWNMRSKASAKFEGYLLEIDPNDATYKFSENFLTSAPLKIEPMTVEFAKSPSKIGKLVGEAKGTNMLLEGLLRNDRKYLFQFVEKGRSLSRKDATAMLIEVDFDTNVLSGASVADDSAHLNWEDVPGANRYKVFADKEQKIFLGESLGNDLVVPGFSSRNLKEFFVLPMRGELASKDMFTVPLNMSMAEVLKVSTSKASGLYTSGEVLEFIVEFSKAVAVSNDAYLPLKIGQATRRAAYVSGEGSTLIRFTYTVQAGDNTDHLETGLMLGGEYTDVNAFSVNGALPTATEPSSLKASSLIALDTLRPIAPSSIGFNIPTSGDGNVTMSWARGSDINFHTHVAKL